MDKVPEGEIKEQFLFAAKNAIDDILKTARPFTVDGNAINGPSESIYTEHLYIILCLIIQNKILLLYLSFNHDIYKQ